MTQSARLPYLENLLGRMFASPPKPKQPPKRPYRIEVVDCSQQHIRYTCQRSFLRFADRQAAIIEAERIGHRPEEWIDGTWRLMRTPSLDRLLTELDDKPKGA